MPWKEHHHSLHYQDHHRRADNHLITQGNKINQSINLYLTRVNVTLIIKTGKEQGNCYNPNVKVTRRTVMMRLKER